MQSRILSILFLVLPFYIALSCDDALLTLFLILPICIALSFDDLILGADVVIRFNRERIRRTWRCLRFDVRAIAA